jgi:hypothetical protein
VVMSFMGAILPVGEGECAREDSNLRPDA